MNEYYVRVELPSGDVHAKIIHSTTPLIAAKRCELFYASEHNLDVRTVDVQTYAQARKNFAEEIDPTA